MIYKRNQLIWIGLGAVVVLGACVYYKGHQMKRVANSPSPASVR
jgi:hypothetical protein